MTATEEPREAVAEAMPLARLEAAVDSVYFLVSDGWQTELESNRWHYARRWARHLPVTLLQPQQRFGRLRDAAATDIDNCEVLPIAQEVFTGAYHLRGLAQAAQVMEHMRRRGHTKPLLWSYRPGLATLYAALPAVARVYHASENYFDFVGMPELFYRELEATVRISDLVIPVSSGVADGIRSRVPEANLELVTNGCDLRHYADSGPLSPEIATARRGFERVAVFAGNVNSRIDFDLVQRAAGANPETVLVFVGPVEIQERPDVEAWRRVRRLANVRHLPRMAPAELAAVYRSADLGFIPYRREPWLVRNGFPLKTLEMAATGLPVVTSHMEPIAGLAAAVAVAEDDDGFLQHFTSLARSSLSHEEKLELVEVAAANDYDRKFEQVVGYVAGAIPADGHVHTRLDDLLAELGRQSWRASCGRLLGLSRPSLLRRGVILAYDGLARVVPARTRRRLIPAALRDRVLGRAAE